MSSKKQRSKEMTTKTNNETPEALSHIKRAHGIYFTAKVLLGWIIKLYFNFRSKVYRPKNKSFILISNHTTMFDPFFEALSALCDERPSSQNGCLGKIHKVLR